MPGVETILTFKAVILHKLKILLVKRSGEGYFAPDKWEFPGGKLKVGERVEDVLEKEVFEETGLTVSLLSKLGYMQTETADNPKYKGLPVIRVYMLAKSESDRVKLSKEHTDSKWVLLSEAYQYDLSDQTRKALQILEEGVKTQLWRQ